MFRFIVVFLIAAAPVTVRAADLIRLTVEYLNATYSCSDILVHLDQDLKAKRSTVAIDNEISLFDRAFNRYAEVFIKYAKALR
jgi:hypothetical protein